jgi:hypothetical protein
VPHHLGCEIADNNQQVVLSITLTLKGNNTTLVISIVDPFEAATGPAALFIDRGGFGGFHGGGGGFHGGGDFGGGGPRDGGGDHFSNYAHVQDPHSAWYRSDSGNRTVNYDPHNNYNGGGGYNDNPWAAGAAGLAAGAAIGAGIADNNNYPYPYPYCGYAPYPPC